jgi:hypothetical protein
MNGAEDIPVLDAGPLQTLATEVGPAFAEAFIDDYLQMLPDRASKILRALASGDPRMAADAVVSLKATSAMAGALLQGTGITHPARAAARARCGQGSAVREHPAAGA